MKLPKTLKRLLVYSFTVLYGAGLCYWLCRLFLRRNGAFGEENHWLEGASGPLHLFAGLFFIFVVGIIWAKHIEVALKRNRNRATGWFFLSVLAAMGATGIVILYGSSKFIAVTEKIHPILGTLLLPILLFHGAWLSRRRIPR